MSKIFMIGDTHLSLGYPNSYHKWFKIHQQYFSEFLIPLLKEKVEEGDIIMHLGDLFDNRDIIPIEILNYGMNIVEEISKIAPFHIIIGNHDLWTRSHSEINSVRPFKYIPNVYVYDKTTQIDFNGLKLCLMPYIESKEEQVESIKENKNCDYLFCHSDLNGCRMHLTSVAHKNKNKIDVEEFNNFKKVYSAHIHIRQVSKNFEFIGSIFQMDRNDMNDRKGITILDTNDGSSEFIENLISPEFKKVYLLKEDHIDKLDQLPEKDFIDLIISNSLLIGNRKIRRKLEVMLEKGIFSSVDYIDDITEKKELTDEEKQKIEKVLESIDSGDGSKLQINLEYKELIRDYINNLKYDSEKNKLGIMSEYEEIIKIYEENYTIGE
jgi:calcineurin-like phosphoesterase family protein